MTMSTAVAWPSASPRWAAGSGPLPLRRRRRHHHHYHCYCRVFNSSSSSSRSHRIPPLRGTLPFPALPFMALSLLSSLYVLSPFQRDLGCVGNIDEQII